MVGKGGGEGWEGGISLCMPSLIPTIVLTRYYLCLRNIYHWKDDQEICAYFSVQMDFWIFLLLFSLLPPKCTEAEFVNVQFR